jgi:hypothetical protein
LKEIVGVPVAASVELVLSAPVLLLVTEGEDGAGDGTTTEGAQGAQSLRAGTLKGTLLRKRVPPISSDFQPRIQKHRALLCVSPPSMKHGKAKKKDL